MKRTLLCLVLFVLESSSLFAQDATTAWRTILHRCAKSDLINRESLFFGVSNTIGPGSVWRFADDKSIRLMFELADAFPSIAKQESIIHKNNVVSCLGNSSSTWNIKLSLPFTTGATPLTLDIGGLLSQAKKVTVSIQGYAMDDLKETVWKTAMLDLGSSNVYAKEILQPNRLLAENVVKVTGFRAIFDYKADIGADAVAKYKGTSFTLGNSSPSSGKQTTSSDVKTISDAANSAVSTATKAAKKTKASNSEASNKSSCPVPGGTDTGNTSASTSSGGNTSGSGGKTVVGPGTSNTASPGTGSATLHVEFTNNRQISICADGPFYLIAAYSKLVNGAPIGLNATTTSLELRPIDVPEGATAASDRKTE